MRETTAALVGRMSEMPADFDRSTMTCNEPVMTSLPQFCRPDFQHLEGMYVSEKLLEAQGFSHLKSIIKGTCSQCFNRLFHKQKAGGHMSSALS